MITNQMKAMLVKMLSFILSVVMLITFLPVNVIAEGLTDIFSDETSGSRQSYGRTVETEDKIIREKAPAKYSQDNLVEIESRQNPAESSSDSELSLALEESLLREKSEGTRILEEKKSADSLSKNEKQTILDEFDISADDFEWVVERTDDVTSVILLSNMRRSNALTDEQIEKAATLTPFNILYISLETCKLNNLKNNEAANYDINKHEQFVEYILDSYKFDEIIPAYIVSELTGIDFAGLKSPKELMYDVLDIDEYSLGDEEKAAVTELANEYGLDIYMLADYVITNNLSAGDIFELSGQIAISAEKMYNYGIQYSAPSMVSSSPNDQTGQKYVTESFKFNYNTNENINLNTGELVHETTDAIIPGVNGLDLVLTRRYESGQSRLYNPSVRHNYEYVYYYEIYIKEISGIYNSGYNASKKIIGNIGINFESAYNLTDAGAVNRFNSYWGFDTYSYISLLCDISNSFLPRVIYFNNNNKAHVEYTYFSPAYAYMGTYYNSSSLLAKQNNTYAASRIDIAAGWSFAFSSIEFDAEYIYLHTAEGRTYLLDINKRNTDNMISEQNIENIRLKYETVNFANPSFTTAYTMYKKDGDREYFDSEGRLRVIEDRFGNRIKFEYGYNGVTDDVRITDTAGRQTTINRVIQNGVKKMIVTLPDSETIEYELENVAAASGLCSYDKLVSAKDQVGDITGYTYTPGAATFSYGSTTEQNLFVNLTKITYPTGASTNYTYGAATNTLPIHQSASGTDGVYRVTARYERESNASVTDKNRVDYAYTGNYTNVSSGNTYGVTVSDGLGYETAYTFNNKHLCINEEHKVNAAKIKGTVTEYHTTYKLPTKITTTDYNGVKSIESSVMYEYDAKGNILTYWDKQANGSKANTEHKTAFTYDSVYSMPLTVTYKTDANTTIKQTNILSVDKKTVIETNIKENNVIKERTTYLYDGKGNITEKRAWLSTNSFGTSYNATQYSYADNVANRTPSFDGVYLTGVKQTEIYAAGSTTPVNYYGGVDTGTIKTSTKYDIMGRVAEVTDGNGNTSTFGYDAAGRITQVLNPDSTGSLYAYTTTTSANTTLHTNEKNFAMLYIYDTLGNLLNVKENGTAQAVLSYTYDNYMRKVTESNVNSSPNGAVVTTVYDAQNRVVETYAKDKNNVEMSREQYAYDVAFDTVNKLSRVTKTLKGEAGIAPDMVSHAYYDVQGQVAKQSVMDGGTEQFDVFTYDYVGNVLTEKTAYTASLSPSPTFTARYTYDYAGRVISTENANNETANVSYHSDDAYYPSCTETTLPSGAKSRSYYDAAGRLAYTKTEFEEIGSVTYYAETKYSYDAVGNIIREQTANNTPGATASWTKTDYAYDNRGFLTAAVSYDGILPASAAQYDYDALGNVLAMTVGVNVTSYEYDSYGNVLSVTDGLSQEEHYIYDLNGNLLTKTDRNGTLFEYEYDGLGRVLSTVSDATTLETYTYTQTGAVRSAGNATLTSTNTYDNLGRLTQVSESDGVVKTYTYDIGGNRTSFATAGISTTYTYDKLSRLATVSEGGAVRATYSYDANGNRASLTYGNGVVTTYAYNLANLVTSVTNGNVSSYTYEYQLDGNQTKKTDNTGKITTYVYDGLGRLTSESEPNSTIAYTYDEYNNRSTMDNNGTITMYIYDLNNRLTQTVETVGTTVTTSKYTYDANGNTLTKMTEIVKDDTGVPASGSLSGSYGEYYAYDLFNRMVYSLVNGIEARYAYRHDGLRYSKNDTVHLWDGSNIVGDVVDGVVEAVYVRGIGLIASKTGGVYEYYLFNAHGDVVQHGNSKTYDYDAFGNEKESASAALILSGTQYINTGITPNGLTTKIEVDFEADTLSTNQFVFGARTGMSDNTYSFVAMSAGYWRADYYNKQINSGAADTERHTIVLENGVFKLDGQVIRTNTAQNFTAGSVLSLGGVGVESASRLKGKLYGAKIWESGVLVRDFVAVAAGSTEYSDVPAPSNCMWDRVTEAYYENAGTGNFGYEPPLEDVNPFRYCGEYWDGETGTVYLRARYYDPRVGRFLTEDPIGADLNWYTYCNANPILFYDPTGLDSWVIYAICDDDKENEGQKRAAKIRAAKYEEQYGTPCYVCGVSSAAEFVRAWSLLGFVDITPPGIDNTIVKRVRIDAVEVIAHGSTQRDYVKKDDYLIGYIFFKDGSRLYAAKNSNTGIDTKHYSVDNLNKKNMDSLYFGACNTANQDFKVNIATAFFNYMPGINNVTGWDGGVVFVETDKVGAIRIPKFPTIPTVNIFNILNLFAGKLVPGTGTTVTVNEYRSSPSQDTFNDLIKITGNNRSKGPITLSR